MKHLKRLDVTLKNGLERTFHDPKIRMMNEEQIDEVLVVTTMHAQLSQIANLFCKKPDYDREDYMSYTKTESYIKTADVVEMDFHYKLSKEEYDNPDA
jgi:hypothetical protein